MGFLSKLLGMDGAAESVVNNVSNGIDKLFYTEEEEAEDKAAARREGYAVYMEWLKSTSGSRVARRLLAIGTFCMWSVPLLGSVVMRVAAIWSEDATKILSAAGEMQSLSLDMIPLVALVYGFYFGGPVVAESLGGMLGKWAGNRIEVVSGPPGSKG